MASWLKPLLATPQYPENAELNLLARMFYIVAIAHQVAVGVVAVYSLIVGQIATVLVLLAEMAIVFALMVLAHSGRVRLACRLLPPLLVVMSAVLMLRRDGVHNSVIVVLAAAVVSGGILLDRRFLAMLTAVTVATVVGVGYAEISAQLHNRMSDFTDWRFVAGLSLSYVVIAITISVLMESLNHSLRVAHDKSAALAASNAKLELQAGALRESESRFSKAFQASPAPTTISRKSDGTFLEVNEAWLRTFGYARDEVIGRRSLEIPTWAEPEDRKKLFRMLEDKGSVRDEEFRFRKKSGEVADVLLSVEEIDFDGARALITPNFDITERKKSDRMLRQSEERLAKIFRASPDPIVISRLSDGTYLEVNQAWLDNFGYSREELIGHSALELGIWANPEERSRLLQLIGEQGAVRSFETRLRKKSGELADVLLSAEAIDLDGEPYVIFPLVDISERKRAEQRIQHLATRDALTGLPNRLLLTDRLALSVSSAQRSKGQLALLFIDLDRFKNINDSLGHPVGDTFLKAVSERLSGIMRKGDTLARVGGDEFVVLLENFTAAEEVGQVARKILDAFATPFSIEGHMLSTTCSIGISVFPGDASDPQTLVREADTAMYHAKERGRGNYQFYSAEMNARVLERLRLENSLREAVSKGQFKLAYQPKVDVASGRITGVEALLRWRHPELGNVAPERFIAVAEETGLIVDIGLWVLRTACRQVQSWREHGFPGLRVAVNLSVRQFSRDLVSDIAAALRESGADPALIELEITESLFMQHPEENGAILKELTGLGMHVTLDDFGTGYASLNYIKRFFVDALKIDRSFVSDITTNPQDLAIVKAVIAMAQSLGIKVIAEGVESQSQLQVLRELGCDEYQGYLFCKPMFSRELEQRFFAS